MLAINCRAYQAALILFDTIKRVANRECTNVSSTVASAPSVSSHTNVPYYDHLKSSSVSYSTPCQTESSSLNTEDKLKNVMSAFSSKDSSTPVTPAQATGTAPDITLIYSHVSGQSQSFINKNLEDIVDWLYPYHQQQQAQPSPPPQLQQAQQQQQQAGSNYTGTQTSFETFKSKLIVNV